jgi:hypothetical protein
MRLKRDRSPHKRNNHSPKAPSSHLARTGCKRTRLAQCRRSRSSHLRQAHTSTRHPLTVELPARYAQSQPCTIVWNHFGLWCAPAIVSLPNFARECVSAPLQVPAGADFGSLLSKGSCSSISASQVRIWWAVWTSVAWHQFESRDFITYK